MQLIHLAMILLGLTLLGSFTHLSLKAFASDRARQFAAGKQAGITDSHSRMNALNTDLASIAVQRDRDRKSFLETIERKNREIETLKQKNAAQSLSQQDMQTLLDIVQTLSLAHKTWLPITGTEPWRRRATAQVDALNQIANRLIKSLETEAGPSVAVQASQVNMIKGVA